MWVVKAEKAALLLLDLSEVAGPADDVILVFVIIDQLRVHEVFDNLLTSTVLQEVGPSCPNTMALHVVMHEWVLMEVIRGAHVNICATCESKQHKPNDCVDASRHDGALAEAEVPNL